MQSRRQKQDKLSETSLKLGQIFTQQITSNFWNQVPMLQFITKRVKWLTLLLIFLLSGALNTLWLPATFLFGVNTGNILLEKISNRWNKSRWFWFGGRVKYYCSDQRISHVFFHGKGPPMQLSMVPDWKSLTVAKLSHNQPFKVTCWWLTSHGVWNGTNMLAFGFDLICLS